MSRDVVNNLVESQLALEEIEDETSAFLYEEKLLNGQKEANKHLKVLQDKYLGKKKFLFGDARK